MAADGLRERKKRRMREEISDVATRLFAERGFEQVTLAEIAAAAEVSVKTIFNHFGSKEELYFDRLGELRDALVATITERPRGVTVLGALHALMVDNLVPFPGSGWDADPARFEQFRAFLATEERSAALRARRALLGAELADTLGAALAATLGRPADDEAVRTLAAFLVAVMAARERVLRRAVFDGRPLPSVRERVTAAMAEAFDRLERAFADVDRPAG